MHFLIWGLAHPHRRPCDSWPQQSCPMANAATTTAGRYILEIHPHHRLPSLNTAKHVGGGQSESTSIQINKTTVVPRIVIALYCDEIALRWTFCHRKSDRFAMVPMGEICFAMIAGKRSSQSPHFRPTDRRFQNGRRVNKMAARCFQARIPRFRGTENGGAMEDLRSAVSFKPIGTH